MDFLLTDMLEQNADGIPDHPCLLQRSTSLTWSEFRARVSALARGLAAEGVGPGERVAVVARNAIDYVTLQYALMLGGGILVPLGTRLLPRDLAGILADCEPVLLLHDAESAELASSAAASIDGVWNGRIAALDGRENDSGLWAWVDGLVAAHDPSGTAPEIERSWRTPHAILYTGGTTGRPKGAVITHRRNVLDGLSVVSALGIRPHERFLLYSPLSHTAAWDYMKAFFLAGGSVVIMGGFDASEAIEALERHACTGFWAVPLTLRQMIDHPRFAKADLSSVRLIAYSAYDPSSLIPEVVAAFERQGAEGLQLAHGYGLTEGGPFVTILRPEDALDDPNSVGTPVPGVHVALLDHDGAPVERGGIGEVCARTAAVMDRYWNRPEETAKIFRGGWLHTGDVGMINEHGHLMIVDREKDMIRSAGENVYAKEVESALVEHPLITDCAVIGQPDPIYDERVVAVIVTADDAALSEEDVRRFAQARLARFKVPKAVIFVDMLPKTPAGKTEKRVLRERYAGTGLQKSAGRGPE